MEVSEYLTELAAVTRRAGIERTARRIGVYPSTVAFFCDHPESAPPLVVSRIAATADRISLDAPPRYWSVRLWAKRWCGRGPGGRDRIATW